MKLLLTSGGLTNKSIADALEDLVGKPRKQIKIAFIPNAAYPIDDVSVESRDWLVDDLYRIKEFCGYIDIVSLVDLTRQEVRERLEYADVIFVGGGNSFYLSYIMDKSGLFDALPELLKTRVYAGISAGSMIATKGLQVSSQALKKFGELRDDEYDELGPKDRSLAKTAKFVNFYVRPHLNSVHFPKIRSEEFISKVAPTLDAPLYAIDDNSALKIVDGEVEVVSEGEWKRFN